MKLRPFELTLVVIFTCLALLAIVLISNINVSEEPVDDSSIVGNIDIWGTLPEDPIVNILNEISEADKSYEGVTYKYVSPEDFDDVLVNALAEGSGPDLALIPHEMLVTMRRRIRSVPFESYPIRDIRSDYIDGAQIFALNDGLYAYPIAVDPLMMYWNLNILANEGFLTAPKTWEELVNSMFAKLIRRDSDRTIGRSVVAMGESDNVRNSFAIISALLIQGGTEGVTAEADGEYKVKLRFSVNNSGDPLRSAVDFYTRFSKPSNALYSWNRSFEEDRQKFISEDLALYFGFGSEGVLLEKTNPNLNFDIAEIPQGASASIRRTYGTFYGLSVMKTTDNLASAGRVMSKLASYDVGTRIAVDSNMVPVHRNAVSAGSNDTYGRLTYQSASIALGWLNPDMVETERIFATMMSDVNENRQEIEGSVSQALERLSREY